MSKDRLDLGALPARARGPFRHVPRLGAVQPEAEAIADFAFSRQHTRDQGLLAGGKAQRLYVGESYRNGVRPLRVTRP